MELSCKVAVSAVSKVYIQKQSGSLDARKNTKALCLLAVVAVLIATLWPLNPFPRNGVTWLQGTNGLKFDRSAVVVSNGPLKPIDIQSTESYALELLLRPARTRSASTIMAVYKADGSKQFLVRQWTDGLIVTHDAAVESDSTRAIKFDVNHVFNRGKLVLITISSGTKGTTVYLDGRPVQSVPSFRITRSELSGEIVLGTSPGSYQQWSGELRGLAIYSKELTPADAMLHYNEWTEPTVGPPDLNGAIARYTFAEAGGDRVHNEVVSEPNLDIPATFSVPHKSLLESPAGEFRADRKYARDLLTNIIGFVPLGLIVCAYFTWTRSRWNSILITTFACGTFSFLIEVLQFYIPRRGSGITDIITNTLGAALGAALIQTSVVRHVLEEMKLIPSAQQ